MQSNLKIGAQAESFYRWKENCYNKARELGFSYIDYDLCDTDKEWYQCDEAKMKEMMFEERERIEAAGITVSQVHGPWRWPPQDDTDENRAERLEKMKRSIVLTKYLGCKYFVIHPIMPYGIEDKLMGEDKVQSTWDLNWVFMNELLQTAKEHDIVICFENMPMPNFAIGSPEEILQFVEKMNDEHFQICLDTGHVAVYENENLADAVRLFGDHMKVMHVHDNDGTRDQHLLPYFGVINWEEFGAALKEIGYEGVFSFETSPPKKLPNPVYEKACSMMYKMAENLLQYNGDNQNA